MIRLSSDNALELSRRKANTGRGDPVISTRKVTKMGLKDQAEYRFEVETETAVKNDDATATQAEATTTEKQTMNTTAIAPAANTAVGAAKKFTIAFGDVQNALPIEVAASLSLAAPRIKAEQGAAYIGEKSLGAKFRLDLESWNYRWLISTGTDDKESKDYLKTSYDNQTIYGEGQTVAEYLAHLKDLGFKDAKSVPYGDLWGFVTWTEKDGEVAPEDRQLHVVQASQTSLGAFMAFCTTQGLLRSRGIASGGNQIEIHAMARSKGSNKFSNFDFTVAKSK